MVFTDQLDLAAHPLASRKSGVAIGTYAMVFFGAALVSPRTIPFALPVLAVLAVVIGSGRHAWNYCQLRGSHVFLGSAAFTGLTMASALWAGEWDAPFKPATVAIGYLLVTLAITEAFSLERRSNAFHIAEGMWIGFLAALAYLLIEILSGQAIKLSLYRMLELTPKDLRPPENFTWRGTHLVAISPSDLTRNIAPITLFFWPSLLAICSGATDKIARIVGVALFATAATVIAVSEHETSKIAIVCSIVVFAAARANAQWSLSALRVFWVAACLAVIPASLAMYRADLHEASWLQWSARHRIVIWNHTAEEALKSPILGMGAGMMYRLGSRPQPLVQGQEFSPNVPHAHNVYLQTWFELGAVGAVILTLIGLAMLKEIGRLSRHVAPYAQATFASAMVVAAASYGMWQPWFIAMFSSAAAAFAIARRVAEPHEFAVAAEVSRR